MSEEFTENDEALPQYDLARLNTLSGFMDTMFELHDVARESCMPVIVEEYDREKRTVSIRPLVKYVMDTKTGKKYCDRPLYEDISIVSLSATGYIIDFPLEKGSTGLLVAVDRNWKKAKEANADADGSKNEGPCEPEDQSLTTFENGVFIPYSFMSKLEMCTDGMNIGNVRNKDTDYCLNFAQDRINFKGNITREMQFVTNVRWNELTEKLEKKYVDVGMNGDLVVKIGNESDWVPSTVFKMSVMTEWKFDQASYGAPIAYINGKAACNGHSTDHIIDYLVTEGDVEDNYDESTGVYTFVFTMSIRIQDSQLPGGPCIFRCWDKRFSSYEDAPDDRRASVDGNQNTVAKFIITFEKKTEKWFFSAV